VPAPLWRHPAFLGPLLAAAAVALTLPLWWESASAALFDLEFAVAAVIPQSVIADAAWFLLPPLGLAAGLLASFSPCILPLIPLNVAAIGASEVRGWRAAALSARFVGGAAFALALLGLFGDLAGFLLVEQRGPVLVAAGLAMLVFGLVALEVLPLPLAGRSPGGGRRLGPFAAGAVFSLVTTPCASPLVGAVLAAAGAWSVPGLAAASMACFAVGYTALVFAAGVFGGALLDALRRRSFDAPRAASAALLLVLGIAFTATGIAWF
jgi:cytochrome c-type biogenesis protein